MQNLSSIMHKELGLALTLLNSIENNVDPDQLASEEAS